MPAAGSTSRGSERANGRCSESATCRKGAASFPTSPSATTSAWGIAAHDDGDEAGAIRRIVTEFPRLERLLDRDGSALSGGEQQLLAIARCLVSEPELILLDEPTEGIQPSIVDEIATLLADLNRRRGVAVVLVEQNLDFITELSSRVLLLQKGVISGEVIGADAADPVLIDEFTRVWRRWRGTERSGRRRHGRRHGQRMRLPRQREPKPPRRRRHAEPPQPRTRAPPRRNPGAAPNSTGGSVI